jgi:isopropylmalate/homocitrate/citramalate synthase
MEKKWIDENWHSSLYNYLGDAQKDINIRSDVVVADCTLRESDQYAGVALTKESKLSIARALDDVGIQQIEIGMPAITPVEKEASEAIVELGLNAKLTALCRARKDDIDLASSLGVWGVLISLPSGYLQIEHRLKWSLDRIIETALEMTAYAREKGLYVVLSPYDTTRSDPEFLQEYLSTVTAQGTVDRVRLVDTTGCITPHGITQLIRIMRESIGETHIEVHCHNDYGLAVANTLAALGAGANVISSSFNGMGERAGNTPTEEIVTALQVLYGLDLGINLDQLYRTSLLVQELTGVTLQPHKPVVGKNAFTQISGLVIAGFAETPFVGLSYLPEMVGRHSTVSLGKATGSASIRWKLDELGLSATKEQIIDLVLKVKEIALEEGRDVNDDEFEKLVEEISKT